MKKILFIMLMCIIAMFAGTACAAQAPIASAGPDLYVNSGQNIIFQGSGYDADGGVLTYYWNCSGGSLSSYNVAQPTFTAPSGLQATYTCTLSVTDSTGLSNSDSMAVHTNLGSYVGMLQVSKKVINLTSGNLNWANSVNAGPSNVLSFAITLQATGGQDIHNIVVRDVLPSNLIYRDNLMVNASLSYSGDPFSGINIGTISAGSVAVISYQVQVASASVFPYGTTTLVSTSTITSNEAGTQTALASVFATNSLVYGATTVSTGIDNNILTGSFFLPMMLIVLFSWLYFSGRAYSFADWLKTKI